MLSASEPSAFNAQISGFFQPAAANFPEDVASTLATKEKEPSFTVTL